MSTDLLFKHFDTLATAPDGIARLREMILQLAVQGKLGTQDERDEPASGLLKRVRLEKEQLEKDGLIKKEKVLTLSDDEICFRIPRNWGVDKIGNISFVTKLAGFEYSKHVVPRDFGEVPLIRALNLKNFKFDRSSLKFIDFETSKLLKRSALTKPAILITYVGYVGEVAIFDETQRCHLGPNVAKIEPFNDKNEKINIAYFLLFLKSEFGRNEILKHEKSTAQSSLSMAAIRDAIILIPPLAEQHRIVEKVDRLMALCDDLEAKQHQEGVGCLKLGTASLAALQNAESLDEFERLWTQVCDSFDLILDCPENVEVLRQTILKLAVQGKLGTHDARDEPVRVLFDQIRKEKVRLIHDGKLQKEKSLKFVNSDDVPFNIPREWLWTYFGKITFNRDGERKPIEKSERANRRGAYNYYGASGVIDTIDEYLFDKPLLLIGEDGANLVNRSTPIAFIARGKYWVNNHAHVIDGMSFEFLRYLEIYINSIDLHPYLTGMAQPKLNQAKMNAIPVPLPPLAEQQRIVENVDRLMTLRDELAAKLKERRDIEIRCRNAIINQAIRDV